MDNDLPQQIVSHRDAIYRYVLGLVREPTVADDLTQETLLRAHGRRATLADADKLVPWLYRIATNLCRDRFRADPRRRRMRSLDEASSRDGEAPDDDAPRLDKVMEQREMSGCVQRYVAALPDSYRAVILLHDVEGSTNAEIAEMLRVSLATVKIRLHRARKRLRAELERACTFSTDERGILVCDPTSDEAAG